MLTVEFGIFEDLNVESLSLEVSVAGTQRKQFLQVDYGSRGVPAREGIQAVGRSLWAVRSLYPTWTKVVGHRKEEGPGEVS